MWMCVMGIKKYMVSKGNMGGIPYKEHIPGV